MSEPSAEIPAAQIPPARLARLASVRTLRVALAGAAVAGGATLFFGLAIVLTSTTTEHRGFNDLARVLGFLIAGGGFVVLGVGISLLVLTRTSPPRGATTTLIVAGLGLLGTVAAMVAGNARLLWPVAVICLLLLGLAWWARTETANAS